MVERRAHARYAVWFPVVVTSSVGEGIAISYDVSAGGLLVACPGRLEPGAEVEVTFRVRPEAPEQRARGCVVRVERNQEDDDGPWRWRIAVEFDHPVPEIEALLASSTGVRPH
jgi:hypothetical protein